MLLLLVPTMVWTVVRVPRMRRVVEFLCLLPLAIPAIVIVVGIAPIYRWLGQNLGAVGASPLTLALINIILVLPYSYRALDSDLRGLDTATLADAARSLGAGWPRTIFQVIVPNIRGGILSSSVLAIALVLGEFTISSLLSFNTVQVIINLVANATPMWRLRSRWPPARLLSCCSPFPGSPQGPEVAPNESSRSPLHDRHDP